MRRIAILGSTGSIGRNTLRVIDSLNQHPARGSRQEGGFEVVGLSAYSDAASLLRQAEKFRPRWVCLVDKHAAGRAKSRLPGSCNVLSGKQGVEDLIQACEADTVVLAIAGAGALLPLIKAIGCRKTIVLANKEALVIAGSIIMRRARQQQVKILPVDSEQSAIWQCLQGREKRQARKIYLTASGGPFKDYKLKQLKHISLKHVLSHPCWDMGRRITVDSATLMNKGLEVIEAMHLFGFDLGQIEVVIHSQAVIHSMVEFIDGIVLAQLSVTDMRIPIQYALTYPRHLSSTLKPLDFFRLKSLDFKKPDTRRFPCLRLGIEAAKEAGSMPCVLNAADEAAVEAFLNKRISFTQIHKIIARVMDSHRKISNPDLKQILAADAWARDRAERIISDSKH